MRRLSLLFALLAPVSGAAAQLDEPAELGDGPDPGCLTEVHAALNPAPAPPPIPSGRAIAELDEGACHALLAGHGVRFEALGATDGVAMPVRVERVAGIRVSSRGHSALHEIVDCRLAVALLAWAPVLKRQGVAAVEHYSTYRPGARVGGSDRVSGHARALALDLAFVRYRDGAEIDVLEGWTARDRGGAPCEGEHEEGEASARLRRLVCAAVRDDLFQVVLTPHYDAAHANHVHLELVPDVDWSFIR
ncbi:MAG: extensin family protein [Myxococcota bacterium]|nr:extensin family protein [Myxococcota bacterium]